ncbi:hypothetical protein HN011_001714, partial [Eciton burchellii]
HGPFATKLAQNLKDNNECSCGKEQTTKHLWESCELKHLCNKEPQLTKLLQDKHKRREFQFLLKEMEKRLKNEERQEQKCGQKAR